MHVVANMLEAVAPSPEAEGGGYCKSIVAARCGVLGSKLSRMGRHDAFMQLLRHTLAWQVLGSVDWECGVLITNALLTNFTHTGAANTTGAEQALVREAQSLYQGLYRAHADVGQQDGSLLQEPGQKQEHEQGGQPKFVVAYTPDSASKPQRLILPASVCCSQPSFSSGAKTHCDKPGTAQGHHSILGRPIPWLRVKHELQQGPVTILNHILNISTLTGPPVRVMWPLILVSTLEVRGWSGPSRAA